MKYNLANTSIIITRFEMSSKQTIKLLIDKAKTARASITNCSVSLLDYLNLMDDKIVEQSKPFGFFSICGAARSTFRVPARFQTAFLNMSQLEKVEYYNRSINHALRAQKSQQKQDEEVENFKKVKEVKIYNDSFKVLIHERFEWKEKVIRIQNFIAKINKQTQINLKNYLIRKSKKKQRKCMVLESIVNSTNDVIRISFSNNEQYQRNMPAIIQIINQAHYLFVQSLLGLRSILKSKDIQGSTNRKEGNYKKKSVMLIIPEENEEFRMQSKRNLKSNLSIVSEILKDQNNQDFNQNLNDLVDQNNQIHEILSQLNKNPTYREQIDSPSKKQQKIYPNIFNHIMPYFNLKQIEELSYFRPIYKNFQTNLYIYKSTQNHQLYKIQLISHFRPQKLVKMLYNVDFYKVWHSEVVQGRVKMLISSENTAIMYQKHKRYGQWYKERDFIYIRHLFKHHDQYYLIDKSIQNTNFMPFNSIVRGQIKYAIWKVKSTLNGSILTAELEINHIGLTQSKRQQLTLRYLLGFQKINSYFGNEGIQDKLKEYLKLYWIIDGQMQEDSQSIQYDTNNNFTSIKTADFRGQSEISELSDQDIFFTIDNDSTERYIQDQNSQHQIEVQKDVSEEYFFKFQDEKIELDQNGLAILPKFHLNRRHFQDPIDIPAVPITLEHKNILLKDDWAHESTGGFKLINKKRIEAQNNVLKFMMKTLKKNLFSGKGLSGISLPVEIFACDSNLQRSCFGLCLAPHFLQRAYKKPNGIDRFKNIIAFGLSNLLLCLDIQKPFNPILGQTYQGHIAGCPAYAEQISHHPPITSIYFMGRGYKIYGSLEVKGELHMNSGTGKNQGYITIEFSDKQKVEFQSAGWQLSGLTMGQIKLGMKGKNYYFDRQNLLFCQLKFQEQTGLFSRGKWKFNDQIEGEMVRVTEQFMSKFINSGKKISPTKNQIKETFYKIGGRWPISLEYDGQIFYEINHDLPYELRDYAFPLNSNSNYRQDIIYRKMHDIARCQIQKDRLEALQRTDKKLREKVHMRNH